MISRGTVPSGANSQLAEVDSVTRSPKPLKDAACRRARVLYEINASMKNKYSHIYPKDRHLF